MQSITSALTFWYQQPIATNHPHAEEAQSVGQSLLILGERFQNGQLVVEQPGSKKMVCFPRNSGKENQPHGIEPDLDRAFESFKSASEHELVLQEALEKIVKLGLSRNPGNGVEEDDQAALKCFEFAFEKGSLEAAHQLGLMYLNGLGVIEDPKKAFRYLIKAADGGHAESKYEIARMYRQGNGPKRDYRSAFKYLMQLVQDGSSLAAIEVIDMARHFAESREIPTYLENTMKNSLIKIGSAESLSVLGEILDDKTALEVYFKIWLDKKDDAIQRVILDRCQQIIEREELTSERGKLAIRSIQRLALVNNRAHAMLEKISDDHDEMRHLTSFVFLLDLYQFDHVRNRKRPGDQEADGGNKRVRK